MHTSTHDRFEQLFSSRSRPTLPMPGQDHPAIVELRPIGCENLGSVQANKDGYQLDKNFNAANKTNQRCNSDKHINPPAPNRPEIKTMAFSKGIQAEALGKLQYFPNGKGSTRQGMDCNAEFGEGLCGPHLNGDPTTMLFCVFSLVAKYPYRYMDDSNDVVSREFFAGGRLYNREWDLYSWTTPVSLGGRNIILVPFPQVQRLVDEIKNSFEIDAGVPPYPFTLKFFKDGTPWPQYLGSAHNRIEFTELQETIPSLPLDHGETPQGASPQVQLKYLAYRDKCEAILKAIKKSGGNGKKKSAGTRTQRSIEDGNRLKRAQSYFGLWSARNKAVNIEDTDTSGQPQNSNTLETQACGSDIKTQDVHRIARYPFQGEAIVISIDVESYERDHNLITEVGVSTLDTLDLKGIAPGAGGQEWVKQIRSRHFRIKGREHIVNKDFVQGHQEAFRFGVSELVSIEEAGDAVDSCFEWPYSMGFTHAGIPSYEESQDNKEAAEKIEKVRVEGVDILGPTPQQNLAANKAVAAKVLGEQSQDEDLEQQSLRDRNILILGHDIETDLTYLTQLGSQIFGPSVLASNGYVRNRTKILGSIVEELDTAILYRTLRGQDQTRALTSICSDLGITPWYAHNAGNDARYTLEALLAIVIEASQKKEHVQKDD